MNGVSLEWDIGDIQYRNTVRKIGNDRNNKLSRNRGRNRYRNCDRSGSLKLYPSGVFVYLKHVCSRKQPHPLQKT